MGGAREAGQRAEPSGAPPPAVARPVAFLETTAGVAAWVTAVLCLAYLPLFLGQIVFLRDPAHWNYPARWFVRASLLRGDSPLWNPEQGLGFAVLANPLYGLFYPPHWLYLITPRALVGSMMTWQAFAHLVFGAIGMVVLARRLRLPAAAAGIAGIAWGLSGYNTAAWTAGLLLSSAAWLPWVAVASVSLAGKMAAGSADWRRAVAGAAVPVAMALLFGEVFAAAMSALLGAALAAMTMERPGWAGWRRSALALAGAVALAGGIAAVVILPARRIAAGTARGQVLLRWLAEEYSVHPLRLLEMIAPGSMGVTFGDYPAGPIVGEPRIDGLPLFYTLYLGAGVLALGVLALGRRRRLAAWLAVGFVLSLLVSLGRHTPVHQLFRTVIRPLAYMRYPEKYMVWVTALGALLAGVGAARLLEERSPWRRTAALLVALVVVAALAPTRFPARWAPYVSWGLLKATLVVTLVLAAQLLATSGALRRVAPALLVAVVSGDLGFAAWPHLYFAPRQLAAAEPPAARAIVTDPRRADRPAPPRVYRADRTEAQIRRFTQPRSPAELEWHSMQTLIANVVTTQGIATVPGYDAAIPQLLPQLWLTGQKVGQGVLRLLGIEYAVLPIDDPADPVEHRAGLEPMMDPVPGSRLYRVPRPLPRVYLAGAAEVLPDAAALPQLFEPDVVEGGRVFLAAAAGPLPQAPGRAGSCALVTFENTRVVARCRAERAAVAVFIEQHDVGWRAEVDGTPAPLLRANLLMRAVALPAGEHLVALSYTPPGLAAGAVVSALSLLVLAALLFVPRSRRTTHPV